VDVEGVAADEQQQGPQAPHEWDAGPLAAVADPLDRAPRP
jgi:hypothetical protein